MSSMHDAPRDVIALQSRQTAKAIISSPLFAFPPHSRLKKKKDFAAVQDAVRASGRRLHSKHFLLLINPSPTGRSRLGLTVTTKIDKRAVARNRIKRYVREVFRKNAGHFVESVDIVVIARMNSQTLSSKQVEQEILNSLKHARILPR